MIRSGQIVAFYLFDIADTVDLTAVPSLLGGPSVAMKFAPKATTPSYIQYEKPPVAFDGEAVGVPTVDGFRVRFRLYDYGVVSVSFSRPFTGNWPELEELGQTLIENADLEQRADRLCRDVATKLRRALVGLRDDFLSEDYLVFAVHAIDPPLAGDRLLAESGETIAAMLRGERERLSDQERSTILGHSISYFQRDLVIPTWNAALVYDTEAGSWAALEILEFANSQLLEFRYYDRLLDVQLAAIYEQLRRPRWSHALIGSRYTRAAQQVHSLFIDVNELTDRTENALKFVGDIYAARLFSLIADRLGLQRWKANVQEKLQTLDAIYRFAVERTSMSRGQFLELTVVLILVLELLLVFLGVMC